MKPKYILFTGAPGSKWSSVANGISNSPDIDTSDRSPLRQYKDSGGVVHHQGAYWDPGMEYTNDRLNWDKPFHDDPHNDTRIIKSHTFSHKLEVLTAYKFPIVICLRPDVECWYWWKKAGGMKIKYPSYQGHYLNEERMWGHIQKQNTDIQKFLRNNWGKVKRAKNNRELCRALGICPQYIGMHDYVDNEVMVYIWTP